MLRNLKMVSVYEPVVVVVRRRAFACVGGRGWIVLFDCSLPESGIDKILKNHPAYARFGWAGMGTVAEFVVV